MAKPTLGRGLGELLGSNRTSAEPSAPVRPPGVGLRILIDGGQPESESVTKSDAEAAQPPGSSVQNIQPTAVNSSSEEMTRALAVVALIGADLALLTWPTYQVATHPGALSGPALTVCAASIILGALCGCAAAGLAAARPSVQ